jgi:hypothetical protein
MDIAIGRHGKLGRGQSLNILPDGCIGGIAIIAKTTN